MSQLVCYICCDNCRFVSNDHIFNGHSCKNVYIYLFPLSYKRDTEPHLVFFFQKIISFFSYKKNLFLWEQEHWCSEGSGILSLYTIGTNGLSYLGRGAQSNFPTSAVGRFLSKDSVYTLQLRLYLSSLNLFFPCAYCML